MSYILDALRKSQAERERGRVPGLDAQPEPGPRAAAAPADARRTGGLLAVAGVGLALVLGAASWWLRPAPAPVVATVAPATVAPAVVAPPVQAPVQAPVRAPLPAPLPVVVSAPPTVAPTIAPTAAPTPASVPAPVLATTAPRAVPLAQLAADQRRDLPPLVLGGSIWSESALGRFVIVNGQVVREGETAAPGVVLEQITPRSLLVRWRALRIELPL